MVRVLVTGGAGYIGAHAVLALLDAGHRPVVVDDLSTGDRAAVPAGVPFEEGDVGDRDFIQAVFARHRPDAVMHFAGSILVEESVRDPLAYFRNNTAASLSLVEASVGAGCNAFIFSSSAAVYGAAQAEMLTEAEPTLPINPYGSSKLMTERMLAATSRAYPAFRSTSLRYFNVAGADPAGRAGSRGRISTHLIQTAVDVALNLRDRLCIYGDDYPTRDGSCERDYVHVSDLAAAHVFALDHLLAGGAGETFNCGYGHGYTVLEVIAALEDLLGRPLPVERGPRRPGDPPRLVADASRLRQAMAWTPAHDDLRYILKTALDWRAASVVTV